MVDDDEAEKALKFLKSTDKSFAAMKGLMVGLEKQEKTVLGMVFLESSGTVAEREAMSRVSDAYAEWRERFEDAVAEYETMRNMRVSAATQIEVWRSENANRRTGNVW